MNHICKKDTHESCPYWLLKVQSYLVYSFELLYIAQVEMKGSFLWNEESNIIAKYYIGYSLFIYFMDCVKYNKIYWYMLWSN